MPRRLWYNINNLWGFVSSYLKDERIGIHADSDYIIAHTDFLKAQRRKARRKQEGL